MKNIILEGDKYYERNKENQAAGFENDLFQQHLYSLPLQNANVLDIGCATGFRLNDLAKRGAQCFGIDPSAKAIEDGKNLYPDIELTQGTAHTLPYADNQFDIVFVNFVLYSVPRELLFRTISEMDRVLKDGGRLIIADFFPDTPHRRPDRHADGEYTYKHKFWQMFIASDLYTEIARVTYEFRSSQKNDALKGGDNDCILVDMQKSLEENYPVRNL